MALKVVLINVPMWEDPTHRIGWSQIYASHAKKRWLWVNLLYLVSWSQRFRNLGFVSPSLGLLDSMMLKGFIWISIRVVYIGQQVLFVGKRQPYACICPFGRKEIVGF